MLHHIKQTIRTKHCNYCDQPCGPLSHENWLTGQIISELVVLYVVQMNISTLLYMAQHWKNKFHVLNSVNSIMTMASLLLYTKHFNFPDTPETWEGKIWG